jgi:hypothetical protein
MYLVATAIKDDEFLIASMARIIIPFHSELASLFS